MDRPDTAAAGAVDDLGGAEGGQAQATVWTVDVGAAGGRRGGERGGMW